MIIFDLFLAAGALAFLAFAALCVTLAVLVIMAERDKQDGHG